MSYIWFNSVLEALGKRLSYEAVVNLYGNSFAKDAASIVSAANPLFKNVPKSSGAGIMGLMGQIKVIDASKSDQQKIAEKTMGDISWAEGLFD